MAIARRVQGYRFDRVYGGWWEPAGRGHATLEASMLAGGALIQLLVRFLLGPLARTV